ncbi:Cu(I)-responsive transcriptional regulator [Glaciimonas sp. PAMC28666]|uniref:Cu(I)-responsive transcriptional regulator n=1 Tax=Glaciimonas sp. PAMC28666 TaxID=2807626 RepID=UPI0019644580|nr:Cu(I)-responsive transcriptional regulator [Glaciimonas sp. PAMC28666]QRX84761.1 Cu(I)-responsive transcriptional regulator [Glaciimonas sp. PAMC28666]
MNIGGAANASGVSAKMIRHYEEIGLIPPAARTDAGYRLYSERDVHLLRFIRQSRMLGFSMKQIAALIGLWLDQSRPSSKVKQLAQQHIRDLNEKIIELQAMKSTLERLANNCHGDARPECPILDGLAQQQVPPFA